LARNTKDLSRSLVYLAISRFIKTGLIQDQSRAARVSDQSGRAQHTDRLSTHSHPKREEGAVMFGHNEQTVCKYLFAQAPTA
jgi:hypothetical protein